MRNLHRCHCLQKFSQYEKTKNTYWRKSTGPPLLPSSSIQRVKNTSGRLLSMLSFFFRALLYTHSRNNWSFLREVYVSNNWALFAVHAWFLNHEAKASWYVQQHDKTAIALTKYSCKCSYITKIRNFLRSFSSKFSLFNQGSQTFLA